ncbi:phage integrase SAM-like domain-containing protein [Chryseobacterium sp. M5A1_1a]
MKNKTILTPDGEFYRVKTIKTITQNTERISEFLESLGYSVHMHDVNFDLCEKFRFYLIEKGLSKNTISQYLSNLRAWIKRFHKIGLMPYSGAGIRCSMELTTAIFNTIAELKEIYKLDLPPGKQRVRDIYICQCFLGLRVSDLRKFIKQIEKTVKKVDGKLFFEIKTSKTGEVVVIPTAIMVLKIFEKYNYDFGKGFSEQYYRRTLKEIFAASDIDREILFHRTEGGEKIERTVMYSDLMGTHTARRTFASNAYLAGLNPLDIMKITGHKSFNSFFKYIRCENLATAIKISDHDFFKIEL